MNTIRLSADDVAKNPMVLKALLKNDPELARSMGLIQDESKRTPSQEAAIETATQDELRKRRVDVYEEENDIREVCTHGVAYTITERSTGRTKLVYRDGSERYQDEL